MIQPRPVSVYVARRYTYCTLFVKTPTQKGDVQISIAQDENDDFFLSLFLFFLLFFFFLSLFDTGTLHSLNYNTHSLNRRNLPPLVLRRTKCAKGCCGTLTKGMTPPEDKLKSISKWGCNEWPNLAAVSENSMLLGLSCLARTASR